jgi:hypothetical protein
MCPADLVHRRSAYTKMLDFSFLLEFFQLPPGVFDRDGAIDLHKHHINDSNEAKETGERTSF